MSVRVTRCQGQCLAYIDAYTHRYGRSPSEAEMAAHFMVSAPAVHLGRSDDGPSLARVLDEGGLVWEGQERYGSVEEMLGDLNAGIAQWLAENA